jgi:hypothetical protein
MVIALLKLLPWVLGGALIFGASKADGASTHPAAAEPPPPTDLLSKIDAAYKAADPTQLRAVADELEKRGFAAHAADLRKMAATIDAAVKAGVKAPPAPAVPADSSSSIGWPALTPLPPLATQGPIAVPEDNHKILAGTTALHLKTARKGTEDQTLVARFQNDNQPEAGKADGMYGVKSALVMALKYGIVPPKPYYWRKPYSAMVADQKAYRGTLIAQVTKDPQRSDEWMQAAKEITIGKA